MRLELTREYLYSQIFKTLRSFP